MLLSLRSTRPAAVISRHFAQTLGKRSRSAFLDQFLRTNMASKDIEHNRPIVVSGPSGAGKSTILNKLFTNHPSKFGFSVSHTTRQPREGEKNGREYNFVTEDEFKKLISENGFIEYAQFSGNYYGTSVATVESVAAQERICILDIEMEGVKQIHKHPTMGKTARFLFLSPPDMTTLEQRLRGRGTDSEEKIQKRLQHAVQEMAYSKTPGVHDKIIVNHDIEKTYKEAEEWVLSG